MPVSRIPKMLMLALAAALLMAPATASAQTTNKPYSVVLAPATIPAGQSTMTATFTNLTGQQQLGSADLTAPAALTVLAASVDGAGTASVSGQTIRLRGLALAPGAAVDVRVTVTAPCQATGALTWGVVAKQSNDFKGPPGNNLTLDPSSALTTTVSGGCAVRFLTQPQDARVDEPITGADFDPDGPPVAVEFVDADGARVTSAAGDITLALEDKPQSGDALEGDTTVTAVDGVAAFPDITLGRADGPYTLAATSAGAATAESDPFRIVTLAEACLENVDCTSLIAGAQSSLETTAIADPFASDTGFLLLSLNAGPELDCAGYEELTSDTFTVDVTALTRTKVVTLRIDKQIVNAVSNNGAAFLQMCFGRPTPFAGKTGPAQGVDHDGDGVVDEYVGLLGDCGVVPSPCVSARRKEQSGDGVIVTQAPAGDPRYNG